MFLMCFLFHEVHSYAGPVRSVPLHGCGLAERHPGSLRAILNGFTFLICLLSPTCANASNIRVIFNPQRPHPSVHSHPLISPGPVLGAHQALPDAAQAPARLLLPAARASAAGPPLHPGPDRVFGCPLDPQIDLPCHHLPSNGELKS